MLSSVTSLRINRKDKAIPAAVTSQAGSVRETPWLNPKIVTLFTLVFICGLALGSAVTRVVLHTRMQRTATVITHHTLSLQDLRIQLHLTPAQQQVVEHELDEYAKYYQNLDMDRMDVAEHGKRRILAVLSPDQQKIFLGMFKQPGFPLN